MNETLSLKALVGQMGLITGVAGHLYSLVCPCDPSRRQPEAFLNCTKLKHIAPEEWLKESITHIADITSVCMNGQTILVDGG